MKVERRSTIHIELSEAAAEKLCALLGGIGFPEREVGGLDDLYESLDALFPKRSMSFTDFFVGDVQYRLPVEEDDCEVRNRRGHDCPGGQNGCKSSECDR